MFHAPLGIPIAVHKQSSSELIHTASFADATRRWLSIVGALLLRQIVSHGSKQWPIFTLFLLVIEPVGVIIVFGSVSDFLLRQPVYGPSTVIFHGTGILPYYFFMRISAKTRRFKADRDNRLPCIRPLDEFLSLVVLEYIIMCAASVSILCGLAYFVNPVALPFDPIACFTSVTLITIFACGINLINSAISEFSEAWVSVLIMLSRGMILVSGVFFVMDFMPPAVREWLLVNPLAHAIIWFRTGVFPRYPDYSLDRTYLVLCSFSALVIGFIVERAVHSGESPSDIS
jgi:capsular polysaccharide transport system permease protein